MLTLLKDDPKLKIVLKEFPILGPGSADAARVAIHPIKGAAGSRTRLHRFQMRVPALVQLVVGIAHRLRLAAAEHHLEIDRRQ